MCQSLIIAHYVIFHITFSQEYNQHPFPLSPHPPFPSPSFWQSGQTCHEGLIKCIGNYRLRSHQQHNLLSGSTQVQRWKANSTHGPICTRSGSLSSSPLLCGRLTNSLQLQHTWISRSETTSREDANLNEHTQRTLRLQVSPERAFQFLWKGRKSDCRLETNSSGGDFDWQALGCVRKAFPDRAFWFLVLGFHLYITSSHRKWAELANCNKGPKALTEGIAHLCCQAGCFLHSLVNWTP